MVFGFLAWASWAREVSERNVRRLSENLGKCRKISENLGGVSGSIWHTDPKLFGYLSLEIIARNFFESV